jgi:hypothetical protein
VACERSGCIAVKIVWARTAKKSTKPEEPKIEGKKCERHCKYDVARGRPEQDQCADFLWVLRIVVDVDPVAGIHRGHADVAAEALPSIGLPIDDVCERSTRIWKSVWCAAELGRHLAKVLRLHHSDDCLGPGGFLDGVGPVNVNAGRDDDDAESHNRHQAVSKEREHSVTRQVPVRQTYQSHI